MDISFRKANTDDAVVLIHIYNQSFLADFLRFGECRGYGQTVDEMTKDIKENNHYLIMTEDNPIGTISYREVKPNEFHVNCLCLLPEYQRKGIGTIAFNYLLYLCANYREITLETAIENRGSVSFYRKCGMHQGEEYSEGKVKLVAFSLYNR